MPRLNVWLKRLSVPFLWAAGGLILAAMVLSHIAGLTVLANSFYLAAFVPSGVPVLLAGLFADYVHMALGMLIQEGSILVVIFNAMQLLIPSTKKKECQK